MPKLSRQEETAQLQALQALLLRPENRNCADCGEIQPTWASTTLGCFLCIRCSGIHRRMGTHVSRIKSTTVDVWTAGEIQRMRDWGNARVNAHFLRQTPPPIDVRNDRDLLAYIRAKYESKRFMEPPAAAMATTAPLHHGGQVTGTPYETEIAQLAAMGFTDRAPVLAALSASRDVSEAVDRLVQMQASGAYAAMVQRERAKLEAKLAATLARFAAMGFENRAQVMAALKQAKGAVDVAANLLMDQGAQPASTVAPTTATATATTAAEAAVSLAATPAAATHQFAFDLFASLDGPTPLTPTPVLPAPVALTPGAPASWPSQHHGQPLQAPLPAAVLSAPSVLRPLQPTPANQAILALYAPTIAAPAPSATMTPSTGVMPPPQYVAQSNPFGTPAAAAVHVPRQPLLAAPTGWTGAVHGPSMPSLPPAPAPVVSYAPHAYAPAAHPLQNILVAAPYALGAGTNPFGARAPMMALVPSASTMPLLQPQAGAMPTTAPGGLGWTVGTGSAPASVSPARSGAAAAAAPPPDPFSTLQFAFGPGTQLPRH